MKIVAAITADFDRTFLGLPSRLMADLRGETVIRRTIKRLCQAKELAGVHLLVTSDQADIARSAVGDLSENVSVNVETHDAGSVPWASYVAASRKWSLDSWRGGLAGTTLYDEFSHPWLLEALARRTSADAVLDVPAAAVLIDPQLIDGLIRHYTKHREQARLAIMQTAPGLSSILYQAELLAELVNCATPPGRIFAYHPEHPVHDPLLQPCTCPTQATIAHASGRCIADTTTAMRRLERMLDELASGGSDSDTNTNDAGPDAMAISRWLLGHRHTPLSTWPDELEIEITTADSLPDSTLRPRGSALQRSGQMDRPTFERIVEEYARSGDDRLLVFGGFGDPLLHPEFAALVRFVRSVGILGIAVRTAAVALDEAAIHALLDASVDVLHVMLDATTPETYCRVHGVDHFERVTANLEHLFSVQQERTAPRPVVVCELMKTPETLDEMEPFYDQWVQRIGSAMISGPSRYAGLWPHRAVVNMTPPSRFVCSRLYHRAMVLADGRLTLCDQDFRGNCAVGQMGEAVDKTASKTLPELWQSSMLTDVRAAHAAGRYDELLLCRDCDEWHRP